MIKQEQLVYPHISTDGKHQKRLALLEELAALCEMPVGESGTTQKAARPNIPTGRKNQTKSQVAFYVNVSTRQVEKWMAAHVIPFRRLGRRCVRFDLDAIDKALARYDVKEVSADL